MNGSTSHKTPIEACHIFVYLASTTSIKVLTSLEVQEDSSYYIVSINGTSYQMDDETEKVSSLNHQSHLTFILALFSGTLAADLKDTTCMQKN